MKQSIESLERQGVKYEIFDRVRVEPNDKSWRDAIDFSRKNDFSHCELKRTEMSAEGPTD